jgi:transcriptional regulator GlxA family with amidase domain
MIDVTVVLLERALPSPSIAAMEIFSCAGVLWSMLRGEEGQPQFRVRTASQGGRDTRHWVPVSLRPDCALREVKRTDLIVVPTCEFDVEASVRANAELISWLRRRYAAGATVAGICTGVILLAQAGLLDGRPATTHWAIADDCRQRFPQVKWQPERFVTESERVFCGGGVYASIDLSLYLVERYCGHEVAVQTAKALLLETPRLWQAPYAAQPRRSDHADEPIKRAQAWMVQKMKDEISIDDLAARVGMSERNFARRFKSATGERPLEYLHRLRIEAARHLLESKPRSVADVSAAVGYEDVAFFRRLFKRYTGAAPRAYRARFGVNAEPGRRLRA